jgi:large subunit ribosomal protein L17
MKHRVGYNRLGRKPAHRKALHRNMVTSLFMHERITTTKAKAQAVRRTAEKMITRAKVDSVHNRRMVARDLKDKAILAKLFAEIAPRYKERPGGYTRVLKIGYRQGDAAEMVLLELVEEEMTRKPAKKKASPTAAEIRKPADKSSSKSGAGKPRKPTKAKSRKEAAPEEKAAEKQRSTAPEAQAEKESEALEEPAPDATPEGVETAETAEKSTGAEPESDASEPESEPVDKKDSADESEDKEGSEDAAKK